MYNVSLSLKLMPRALYKNRCFSRFWWGLGSKMFHIIGILLAVWESTPAGLVKMHSHAVFSCCGCRSPYGVCAS